MQNKNVIILGIALAMLFVIPSVMASVTLNTPVTGTNYTTITFNCSKDALASAPVNTTKMEIWYNASGGATGTKLGQIANTSANQREFVGSISIESLTDGLLYNFSCLAVNMSSTQNVSSVGVLKVGIDNTIPTYTFSLSKPDRADYKGTQRLTWTTADATSGVQTTSITVTSPQADRCPTQTWTTSSGTEQDVVLDCTGTYTSAMTITDNAGNSVSATDDTFSVYAPGEKTSTDEGNSFGTFSVAGQDEAKGSSKTFIIIILIILGIWLYTKK